MPPDFLSTKRKQTPGDVAPVEDEPRSIFSNPIVQFTMLVLWFVIGIAIELFVAPQYAASFSFWSMLVRVTFWPVVCLHYIWEMLRDAGLTILGVIGGGAAVFMLADGVSSGGKGPQNQPSRKVDKWKN